MKTAVVSGRVDTMVKERAERVIRASGFTVGDVIKATLSSIAQSGELPATMISSPVGSEPDVRLSRFVEFVESLPPAPATFAHMSDAQMRELLGGRDV